MCIIWRRVVQHPHHPSHRQSFFLFIERKLGKQELTCSVWLAALTKTRQKLDSKIREIHWSLLKHFDKIWVWNSSHGRKSFFSLREMLELTCSVLAAGVFWTEWQNTARNYLTKSGKLDDHLATKWQILNPFIGNGDTESGSEKVREIT